MCDPLVCYRWNAFRGLGWNQRVVRAGRARRHRSGRVGGGGMPVDGRGAVSVTGSKGRFSRPIGS